MFRPGLGEDVTQDLTAKALLWGSAVAGGALFGPVGLLAGAATAVAIICSDSGGGGVKSHASQTNQIDSGRNEEV